MYPLRFGNIYFEKVWGGREFESFRDNLLDGNIGESWDVACHNNGISTVINGHLAGNDLNNLIDIHGTDILGTEISPERFPLLIKLINAREDLSVQVHPDNDYAIEREGDMGKTEVWYVLEADEGAELVIGTKQCSREMFNDALATGNIMDCVNRVPIEKGEVYFVKSGLVHAIGGGIMVAEIQQNSDTTYRLHDYGRGREIHIDKAMEVVNLDLSTGRSRGLTVELDGCTKTYYCLCQEFSLEEYHITSRMTEHSDNERFYIFTCVEGEGYISSEGLNEAIKKGDSIMIPASLGEYSIEGEDIRLLKSYVPDVEKVKQEILDIIIN